MPYVCAECRDHRVGVLAVNITKEMACAVCHRVGKAFLVEKVPDKPAADPRTESGALLREMFTAFGLRTTDDPYQAKGFLLWRPVPAQAETATITPERLVSWTKTNSLYVLAGDGVGVEVGRLFLARGDSFQTGRGYSFVEGMQEILRFLETP